MKNKTCLLLAAMLTIFLFSGLLAAQEPKITVLNPLGQPPPIDKIPMAPRIGNLDGKTIYIVDIAFTDTHQLFTEMQKLLSEKYPKTKWEVRIKRGSYGDDDPKLWEEIKANGHAMIMGVGH
ncbi:MAG: hypothetical protein LBJ21_04355 [Acidobacteriota bacterium]|jgi:hypothetical protein|nr:hypothetical protein [Acidobacteriota bacterium]